MPNNYLLSVKSCYRELALSPICQVGKEYTRPMLSNMVATSPHLANEHLKCDSCDLRCAISVNYTPDFEYSVHKINVK